MLIKNMKSIEQKLRVEELVPLLFKLDNNIEYDVVIKEHKEKRSLNANAYSWSLISKIADHDRRSKEDVYFDCLVNYGQSTVVSVLSSIDVSGFFKYYRAVGKGNVNGSEFTHYRCYKGTSEYNTLEMSIFIDGVINDAEERGIQTMTPNEVERLKSLWGKEESLNMIRKNLQ